MNENDKKKAKKILKWLWNLSLLYVLVFMFYVWQDEKANPELYKLVEERTSQEELSSVSKEWEKEASTINECMPMVHLLSIYNTWLKPLVYFILIMAVATLLIDNWERLRKLSDDD